MWLLILLGLAIVFIVVTTTRFKLHPFLALLLAAFGYGIASGRPNNDMIPAKPIRIQLKQDLIC